MKCCLAYESTNLGISETELGAWTGQGDAEAVGAGYRCCTRIKMSSLLGPFKA